MIKNNENINFEASGNSKKIFDEMSVHLIVIQNYRRQRFA